MPKARFDVDYGPAWAALVDEFGSPLGGEPTHSDAPAFDRSDVDVYGPFITDDCVVEFGYVDWPSDMSDELTQITVALIDREQQPSGIIELREIDPETQRLMIDALDRTANDKTIIITRLDDEPKENRS